MPPSRTTSGAALFVDRRPLAASAPILSSPVLSKRAERGGLEEELPPSPHDSL